MKILAIETSCDETAIAVLEIKKNQPKLLANFIFSQIKVHAPWGGVVPMLAKREHQRNLTPLLKRALKKLRDYSPSLRENQNDKFLYHIKKILEHEPELAEQLIPFLQKTQKPDIDLIAVTHGPGLEPALWVGVNFARTLSYIWNIPILPINHIEGHIAAALHNVIANPALGEVKQSRYKTTVFSDNGSNTRDRHVPLCGTRDDKFFPILTLVVSGGHTQLILIKEFGQYKIIGETRDDAAGEAFDKVAKMLNLGYPGGPAVAAKTAKFKIENKKIKIKKLPRPMLNSDDFDFSFSGLKTAVLYFTKTLSPEELKKLTPTIAGEFQQAIVDVLTFKTFKAAQQFGAKTIMLGGGVACNQFLRQTFKQKAKKANLDIIIPPKNLCADNAAMIAFAAAQKINNKKPKTVAWQKLQAQANLSIGY